MCSSLENPTNHAFVSNPTFNAPPVDTASSYQSSAVHCERTVSAEGRVGEHY